MNKGTSNEEIELLLEDLHNPDSDKRKMACLALGKAKAASAVDHLIEALSDKEMIVRQCAAEALGEIGDLKAVDSLINALQDKEHNVRLEAEKLATKAQSSLLNAFFQIKILKSVMLHIMQQRK